MNLSTKKRLRTFLIFLGVGCFFSISQISYGSQRLSASADDLCGSSFLPKVFTGLHFGMPSSRDDLDPTSHGKFAAFAAEQANRALLLFPTLPGSDVLEEIARARSKFASQNNERNASHFGENRFSSESDEKISVSHIPKLPYLPMLIKKLKIDPEDDLSFVYPITFTTTHLGFRKFEKGSTVVILEDFIRIAHPDNTFGPRIFVDVQARVNAYHASKDSDQVASREEFLRIAHGFFGSMPYKRGSAAIGRIFFEALYYHVNNEMIMLPADVDILALFLPEEEFLKEVEEQILESSQTSRAVSY